MVKILQVIATLDRSGAEKQLVLLATGLPRDEFAVQVCALTRGGPYEAPLRAAGIPTTVLGKRFKLDPRAFWRLGRLIRGGGFDVVQSWLFTANSYARAVAGGPGRPVLIASERCVDRWKRGHELAIDRVLASRTDAIVVNARAVARFYAARGIAAGKLRVIPNAAVEAGAAAEDRAAVLAELGLPAGARLLGFVGRLAPQKGVPDLIWASDLLKRIRPDTYTLIVGDGPLAGQLRDYARAIEILDRVRFLGHRADVARLLPIFDVLVLPSRYEGASNVVLEAMVAGRPVVASAIPGMDEVVIDGRTGFLVPPRDPAAIARACRKILEDPGLGRAMGEAGRLRARDTFSVGRMVESYAALYRELLDGSARLRQQRLSGRELSHRTGPAASQN